MMKVRPYTKGDYIKIKEILEEAKLFDEVWDSEENLEGKSKIDPQSVLVAELNGDIAGCVFTVDYGPGLRYLFRLAVAEKFRKQGVASALMKYARDLALKNGVAELGLFADAANPELLSYYEKRGFKKSENKYHYMWLGLKD